VTQAFISEDVFMSESYRISQVHSTSWKQHLCQLFQDEPWPTLKRLRT